MHGEKIGTTRDTSSERTDSIEGNCSVRFASVNSEEMLQKRRRMKREEDASSPKHQEAAL